MVCIQFSKSVFSSRDMSGKSLYDDRWNVFSIYDDRWNVFSKSVLTIGTSKRVGQMVVSHLNRVIFQNKSKSETAAGQIKDPKIQSY